MNWDTFLCFKSILVSKNSYINKKCAFIVRFFSNLSGDLEKEMNVRISQFLKVLKMLTIKKEGLGRENSEIYDYLFEKFARMGIFDFDENRVKMLVFARKIY